MKISQTIFLLGVSLSMLHAFDARAVEIKNVSDEELKQMAQFEKDHADKANASATKAREIAEKKKEKKEKKSEDK